jgi:hypothetical protein
VASTSPRSSTRTASTEALPRSWATCSAERSTPGATSAGPWVGTLTTTLGTTPAATVCSSPEARWTRATSASAARRSQRSQIWPRAGRMRSAICVIADSNSAPWRSGRANRPSSIPDSRPHQNRRWRASNRRRVSAAVGARRARAIRARSAGAHRGARSAHSASVVGSASSTTAASWASLRHPAAAAAAMCGRSSSARAVATPARTSRTCTPSVAARVSSTEPRSSSTRVTASSRMRHRRCSRTASARASCSHARDRHRRSSISSAHPDMPASSAAGVTGIAVRPGPARPAPRPALRPAPRARTGPAGRRVRR